VKITVAMVRAKSPCYDPLRIKGIKEDSEMELINVMKLKKIAAKDRIFLATWFMTNLQNRTFAIWCARECKTKVKEIGLYIDAIENYYIKKTITFEQLSAANSAAYWAADRAAYWAADSAANRAAYWAADSAANWAADSAANRAAYWAADSAADWAKQVKQIIKILKESK
jgi:hypothetical protein